MPRCSGDPVIRTTAFVHLRPDAAPARVDELIDAASRAAEATDAIATDASRVTNNAFRAGDVMLLGAFSDQPALEDALGSGHVTEVIRPLLAEVAAHVEAVRYTQGATTVREPSLTDGIHRSLLIQVHPNTDPVLVGRFERELAAMPNYIDAIRNSSLSRIDTMPRVTRPRLHARVGAGVRDARRADRTVHATRLPLVGDRPVVRRAGAGAHRRPRTHSLIVQAAPQHPRARLMHRDAEHLTSCRSTPFSAIPQTAARRAE